MDIENENLVKVWGSSLEYYRTRLEDLEIIDATLFPREQTERWKELIANCKKRIAQYEALIDYLKNSKRM